MIYQNIILLAKITFYDIGGMKYLYPYLIKSTNRYDNYSMMRFAMKRIRSWKNCNIQILYFWLILYSIWTNLIPIANIVPLEFPPSGLTWNCKFNWRCRSCFWSLILKWLDNNLLKKTPFLTFSSLFSHSEWGCWFWIGKFLSLILRFI